MRAIGSRGSQNRASGLESHASGHSLNVDKTKEEHSSEKERFDWLKTKPKYAVLQTDDIRAENQLLAKEITTLNNKYKAMLQRVNDRLGGPSHSRVKANDKNDRLRARDVQNNAVVITGLQEDLQLLMRRQKAVGSGGGMTAAELKQKVMEEKKKVKALKLKSKAFGDKLQNDQDVVDQAKQWQKDRDAALGRKMKLKSKLDGLIAAGKRLQEKLAEAEAQSEGVDEYLKDWAARKEERAEKEAAQHLYMQKKYQLQVALKMLQSQKSTKTQKYHQKLKILESEVEKADLFDERQTAMEIHVLKQQKQIHELTQKLQDLVEKTGGEDRSRTEETSRLGHSDKRLGRRGSESVHPGVKLDRIVNVRGTSKDSNPHSGRAEARRRFYSNLRDKIDSFDAQHPNVAFARKPGRKVQLEQISQLNKTEMTSKQLGEDFEINSDMVAQVPQGGRVYMRVSRQKKREGSRKSDETDKKSEDGQDVMPVIDKIKEEQKLSAFDGREEETHVENIQQKGVNPSLMKHKDATPTKKQEKRQQQGFVEEEVAEQGQKKTVEQTLKIVQTSQNERSEKDEEQLEIKRKQDAIASYVDGLQEGSLQ